MGRPVARFVRRANANNLSRCSISQPPGYMGKEQSWRRSGASSCSLRRSPNIPPSAPPHIALWLRLGAHRSGSWRDVLIQVEDVVGVVTLLEFRQPRVGLFAVGCPDSVLPFAAEEVHVDAASREGSHDRPEVARPGSLARLLTRSMARGSSLCRLPSGVCCSAAMTYCYGTMNSQRSYPCAAGGGHRHAATRCARA